MNKFKNEYHLPSDILENINRNGFITGSIL